MKTYLKISQYAFLVVAILIGIEVIRTWGENKTQTILLILLSLAGFFKFFFDRKIRNAWLERRK